MNKAIKEMNESAAFLDIIKTRKESEQIKPNSVYYATKSLDKARALWLKYLSSKDIEISQAACKLMTAYYEAEDKLLAVIMKPENNE